MNQDRFSEGPYKVVNKKGEIYTFSVIGPGVDWPDRAYEGTAKRICEIANAAHAEGRKSMEKEQAEQRWLGHTAQDFRELLELANHMRVAMADIWIVSEEFDAWKKARGIE